MPKRLTKTKTFDGCWTCRRRKVKCPGPRPECNRCTRAGLSCDGFDAKLCWSPDSPLRSEESSWRQRIALPRGRNVLHSYSDEEATRMLRDLEAFSKLSDCTGTVGPFSVFQTDVPECRNIATEQSGVYEHESLADSPPETHQDGETTGPVDCTGELSNFRYSPISMDIPSDDDYTSAPPKVDALLSSSGLIFHHLSDDPNHLTDKLLSHYILKVTNILQPISHPQNPFRSIHAGYAMEFSTKPLLDKSYRTQAYFSSHRVIFHSILSTAAFHLRGFSTVRDKEWNSFDQIGRKHRLEALKYLQEVIAEPSLDAETHCARFSAILTLVTSDLVEGSTSEFFTHLQGCHLVRQLYLSNALKPNLHRSRIRQLDTISFFLTTIAQTTSHHCPGQWNFPPYSSAVSLFDTIFTTSDICLEHTYGVTSSIATTIYLMNKFWHYANSASLPNQSFELELAGALFTLAMKLKNWSLDSEHFESIPAEDFATLSLANDLATSFHCSAQIYFHSCFKFNPPQTDHNLVSSLSSQTLLALEQAEVKKLSVLHSGASICWPAFVAACEAPVELRDRWAKYWHTLLEYRLGNLQAAWEIVQATWSKTDAGADISTIEPYTAMLAYEGTYQLSEPVWTSILRDRGITILAI